MLNAANLVSVGSDGIIRFWNTNYGYLMYEFEGGYAALRYASTSDSTLTNSQSISTLLSGGAGSSNSSKKPVSAESVSAMCTNLSNSILISADCAGWITVWDIRDTCIIDKGSQSLPVISVFQAHVASISNVEFLEQFDLILTASADSSARLFTVKKSGWVGGWDWIR